MSVEMAEVGIVARDGEKLLAFYRDGLGLEHYETLEFPFAKLYKFQAGTGRLKILAPHDSPAPAPSSNDGFYGVSGFRYCALHVTGVDEVVAKAVELGAKISLEPTEIRPGVRTAVVLDPEGNALEIMQGAL